MTPLGEDSDENLAAYRSKGPSMSLAVQHLFDYRAFEVAVSLRASTPQESLEAVPKGLKPFLLFQNIDDNTTVADFKKALSVFLHKKLVSRTSDT